MKRLLVAVGCDSYLHCAPLAGAESDAAAIQCALSKSGYDSRVLRSPSLSELQGHLTALSDDGCDIDVFTFFFAGHGAVKAGSFWMCLRDTKPNGLATTAYSLAAVLQLIQELNPRQANIIIDACESGGIAGDVRAALRANDFGDEGSTGISLLAACAKNQYAAELDGAGLCTSAVLGCVNGNLFVQDLSSDLDLADIARFVSGVGLGDQNPVFWGLNLSTGAAFCRNPHYSHEGPLRQVMAVQRRQSAAASRSKRDMWKIYSDLEDHWEPRRLRDCLSRLLAEQASDAASRLELLMQVSSAFALQAADATDLFREVEVRAACLSCLLPDCDDEQVAAYVDAECARISGKIFGCISTVASALDGNRYALLGQSAVPELFFLPIRISKILGWLGASLHISNGLGKDLADRNVVPRLMDAIFSHYSLSCSSMSELQAPYALAAITGLKSFGFSDYAETYAGCLYKSLCDVRGNVAAVGISSREVVTYLIARAFSDFSGLEGIVARPSELAMCLLLVSTDLGLEEVFDESLVDLDRCSINEFIPNAYSRFAQQQIDGRNHTFKVGFDVWTIAEIRAAPGLTLREVPENLAVRNLSLLSSLLYPDRVCWYLLDDRAGKGSLSAKQDAK